MGSDKEHDELEQDQDELEETPAAEGDEEPKGSAAPEAKKADDEDKTKQDDEVAKHKQMADQERANARRAREALDEARAEKEQLVEELAGVRGEMQQVQSQLKELLTTKEYKDLANLDPETTDVPDLVKAFQAATSKIAKLEQTNAEMTAFIQEQKSRQQTDRAQTARNQMLEEIYNACDEEFGARFRSAAILRADEMVANAEADAPKTVVQGLRLMRKAYAEVAGKHKAAQTPAKKKTVPTDTGLRGLSVTDLEDSDEFKPGTLDEVAADMKKKMKAGTWNRKAFAGPS
jgi:DNA repair exonuclease SbcCD ATPase subunit